MATLNIQAPSDKVNQIAQLVFDKQFANDDKMNKEYDERRKKLMFSDVVYNIGLLETAIKLDDEKIFASYAVWIFQLMAFKVSEFISFFCSLLNYLTPLFVLFQKK